MDEGFELPVLYNGKELMFPAQLHLFGYTQKIEVLVEGIIVMYERDDERNWRAIVEPTALENNKTIRVDLLQAIATSIEELLK